MRLRSFLKHSVGISGILIVILALSYIPNLIDGLWTLMVNYPIIGGMLPSTPLLIGLMSSKQKQVYQLTDLIQHSDISATVATVLDQEIEHFLSGWVQKIRYDYYYHTPFDTGSVYFVSETYIEDTLGGVGNPNVDAWTAGNVATYVAAAGSDVALMRTWNRPMVHHFPVTGQAPADNISYDEQTLMEWVEPGDSQKVRIYAIGDADPASAGSVYVRINVVVIIAAFGAGRSKKRGSPPNYILIFGAAAGAVGEIVRNVIFETDVRLYSIMGQFYGLALDDETYMHLGPKRVDVDDLVNTTTSFTEILNYNRNAYLMTNRTHMFSDTSIAAGEENYVGMKYFKRGPIFIKKNAPWVFQINHESGNVGHFFFSAQVMPDYQNAVDWHVEIDIDETQDSWQFFTIPYDIYVTKIECDINFTVAKAETVTVESDVHLIGLKPGEDDFHAGEIYGFLEYPNSSGSGVSTLKHSAVIDVIKLAAPAGGNGVDGIGYTNIYSVNSVEAVNDYFPRGSRIGIATESIGGVTDPQISMKIEGVVAMKTGKRDTLAVKTGSSTLLDLNNLEAET